MNEYPCLQRTQIPLHLHKWSNEMRSLWSQFSINWQRVGQTQMGCSWRTQGVFTAALEVPEEDKELLAGAPSSLAQEQKISDMIFKKGSGEQREFKGWCHGCRTKISSSKAAFCPGLRVGPSQTWAPHAAKKGSQEAGSWVPPHFGSPEQGVQHWQPSPKELWL